MSKPAPRPSLAVVVLLGLAAANAGLAVYQWVELRVVQGGGTVGCSINDTVNCATVWSSTFATRVHSTLGVPLAGLGLAWSLSAFALAAFFLLRERNGADTAGLGGALKLHGIAGALACVTFASASFNIGAVCLTCLGTYALALAFCGVALRSVAGPPWPAPFVPAAARSMVALMPVYLAMVLLNAQLGEKAAPLKVAQNATGADPASQNEALAYLDSLSGNDALYCSMARKKWLDAPTVDVSEFPTRVRDGADNASVRIVEFTDVLCPHCRDLHVSLELLKRSVPPGRVSIEPRYFPLDKECNSLMTKTSGDGVRCLGAKIQICLEGSSALWKVKQEIFERQAELSQDVIYGIASKAGADVGALKTCVASEQTAHKLDDDIRYANRFNIQGTPLVLVNGKETFGVMPFLLGMAYSSGDPNAPYFQKLPPPPPPPE